MSIEAEQSALGYFQAWLESKADGEITVKSFGAIGNERGGILCVRVKVRDVTLAIMPWAASGAVILTQPQQGTAADITEDMVVAEVTEPQRNPYRDPVPEEHRDLLTEPVVIPEPEEVVQGERQPLPPPAYSPGTCLTCGMFECLHGTECPYCGATGDEPCVTATGFQTSKPHADRRRAHLQTLMDRQRQRDIEAGIVCGTCGMAIPCHHEVGCPACEAEPGKPCVSYTGGNRGRPQPKPHASRTRMGQEREAEGRPNYGGAERYRCPSCEAGQYEWCRSTTGKKKPSPHSARVNRMAT